MKYATFFIKGQIISLFAQMDKKKRSRNSINQRITSIISQISAENPPFLTAEKP